eukprot:1117640-Pelagomonas_calceolata.AAC.4
MGACTFLSWERIHQQDVFVLLDTLNSRLGTSKTPKQCYFVTLAFALTALTAGAAPWLQKPFLPDFGACATVLPI